MSKDIVVIGGGPAGVEAALEAEKSGANVTVISDSPIGGRAGWHSLLPSKVWLSAADFIGTLDGPYKITGIPIDGTLSPTILVDRIAQVKRNWNQALASALQDRGVEVMMGTASFRDERKIQVRDETDEVIRILEADACIVAAGSVPIFPPGLKPDGRQVIAPRFASKLDTLPKSIIVVGAGPTGCESAYMFNRFGVEVIWVVDQFGILPQMHPDLGLQLGMALVRQGVRMVQGQMVEQLERGEEVTAVLTDGARVSAEMVFVAIGRMPDWNRLNLPAAGLKPNALGQLQIDEFGRVENRAIYFVGDVAGGPLIANKAMAQARIAGRHAAGEMVRGYDPLIVAQVTYTDPQAAQIGEVGQTENLRSTRVPFSSALKTHLIGAPEGFIELFYGADDNQVKGAAAVGPHAADVLTPVSVALQLKATLSQLAEIYAPHPTLGELAFIAARSA
jgi:dihydrolipoamide dehydrogenase